jgi:hypothetical protein
MGAQIRFGARDEEGASLVERMEAGEVDMESRRWRWARG